MEVALIKLKYVRALEDQPHRAFSVPGNGGHGPAANLSHIRHRHQPAIVPNRQSSRGANPDIALGILVQGGDIGVGQAIIYGQRRGVFILPAL